MSKIIEAHRKVKNNVGDYFCNPSRYFDIDCSSEEILYNKTDLSDKHLIVGGGGLIHKKFSKHIKMLIDKQPFTTTLWGIGHNFGVKHVLKSYESNAGATNTSNSEIVFGLIWDFVKDELSPVINVHLQKKRG